jgi:hypothetical protein
MQFGCGAYLKIIGAAPPSTHTEPCKKKLEEGIVEYPKQPYVCGY